MIIRCVIIQLASLQNSWNPMRDAAITFEGNMKLKFSDVCYTVLDEEVRRNDFKEFMILNSTLNVNYMGRVSTNILIKATVKSGGIGISMSKSG